MSVRTIASPAIRFIVTTGFVLLGAFWISAGAQTAGQPANPPSNSNDKRDESVDFGSRENDARVRLAIKAEKKAYEEHVARAKEGRDLAGELEKTWKAAKVLNAADQKKLERLEKLTRRIRNEVGGSQTDEDPKELPKTFDEAVKAMAEMAKELCDEVEKTPRRVVSASIIDQANKLIALIQYLRGSRD